MTAHRHTHKKISIFFALLLGGCSASTYAPRMTTISLPQTEVGDLGTALKGTQPAAQITTFEQWTSPWSAICGAVVQYSNGQPAQMIPGNCSTPLTLLNSPVFLGLGTAGLSYWLAH